MSAYLVVEVSYQDLAWTEAYRRDVPQMVAAFGGRYLARSPHPELIEGERSLPDTLAILEFPSAEAARALLAAPEYQPYAEARRKGATTAIMLLEAA